MTCTHDFSCCWFVAELGAMIERALIITARDMDAKERRQYGKK
jgi:hypothetical protein